MKLNDIDCIVPCMMVDWNYFTSNVNSWLEEIPLKTLYFGCSNQEERIFNDLKDYLSGYDKIEFIDQRGIKTLGMQIVDLMKRVNTEWFVYCHSDAYIIKHSFLMMEAEIEDNIGIIESEHLNYNGKKWIFPNYHIIPRSFSGFQLFRKKAIKNILDKIEDDYVFRNEDIIFQNVCQNNGYKFIKSWAFHIHYATINLRWTPQGVECENAKGITYDMQSKGIVKYCTPNEITKKAWRAGFGGCIRYNDANIFDFIENFVKKVNPVWEDAIKKVVMDLIVGVYK